MSKIKSIESAQIVWLISLHSVFYDVRIGANRIGKSSRNGHRHVRRGNRRSDRHRQTIWERAAK